MERRNLAAFAVAAAMFVAAVAVGVFAPGGGSPSAGAVLARSVDAMADESFSIRSRCEHCTEPTILEYAPPDRILLTSGSPRGDNWPYYLYLDGGQYFSQEGERWRTDERDANGWLAGYQRMVDPRVLLTALPDPKLEGAMEVAERPVQAISGHLDIEVLLAAAPARTREVAQGPLGEMLRSATVTFWIDEETHRVLRMRLASDVEDFGESTFDLNFGTPVTIPDSVESMDAEEAHGLSEEIERGGTRLLRAIGGYHRANGTYPPEVTPETIGAFLPPAGWPANAFTGEPVRYAPGTPGNFDYKLIADGQHIQFQIDGWDGSQLYYDSERFGPIPDTVGRLGE